MKKLIILFVVLTASISCEKDSIDLPQTTEANSRSAVHFPSQLTTLEFFTMQFNAYRSDSSPYAEFGALNHTEWFISDQKGNIQYYELSDDKSSLTAIDSFSGVIIDFSPTDSFGFVLCHFDYADGTSITIIQGSLTVTSIVSGGGGNPIVDHHVVFYGPILCAAAALLD